MKTASIPPRSRVRSTYTLPSHSWDYAEYVVVVVVVKFLKMKLIATLGRLFKDHLIGLIPIVNNTKKAILGDSYTLHFLRSYFQLFVIVLLVCKRNSCCIDLIVHFKFLEVCDSIQESRAIFFPLSLCNLTLRPAPEFFPCLN